MCTHVEEVGTSFLAPRCRRHPSGAAGHAPSARTRASQKILQSRAMPQKRILKGDYRNPTKYARCVRTFFGEAQTNLGPYVPPMRLHIPQVFFASSTCIPRVASCLHPSDLALFGPLPDQILFHLRVPFLTLISLVGDDAVQPHPQPHLGRVAPCLAVIGKIQPAPLLRRRTWACQLWHYTTSSQSGGQETRLLNPTFLGRSKEQPSAT